VMAVMCTLFFVIFTAGESSEDEDKRSMK
jgi:hypothetical protein